MRILAHTSFINNLNKQNFSFDFKGTLSREIYTNTWSHITWLMWDLIEIGSLKWADIPFFVCFFNLKKKKKFNICWFPKRIGHGNVFFVYGVFLNISPFIRSAHIYVCVWRSSETVCWKYLRNIYVYSCEMMIICFWSSTGDARAKRGSLL